MRRVIGTLGAFVLVGIFAVDAGARPTAGNTAQSGKSSRVGSEQRQDPRACEELPELRHELARLQQEMRRLGAAFLAAKRAGNRERAQQILMEMRQVSEQIEDVQHKIRRLLQICGR